VPRSPANAAPSMPPAPAKVAPIGDRQAYGMDFYTREDLRKDNVMPIEKAAPSRA
jgi:hypothetical protein